MSEDEWYVNAVVVTWSRIARKLYIPLAIKYVILIAIETKEETPVRLSNEEMEVCIAKWPAAQYLSRHPIADKRWSCASVSSPSDSQTTTV